jgi:amidophosphoribosyltransferase
VRSTAWQASVGARWLDAGLDELKPLVPSDMARFCLRERRGNLTGIDHVRHRRRHLAAPVNQLIYDALLLLQHRGQDAAGIVTMQGTKCFMQKARGMVRDVFRTRNMRALPGSVGLGQVRYPDRGQRLSEEEARPFYVNAPLRHRPGAQRQPHQRQALKQELFDVDRRHINTGSDTEVLINVLAHEARGRGARMAATPDEVFAAVSAVHRRIKGSYAVVALIAGQGLLAFRDPVRHPPALVR